MKLALASFYKMLQIIKKEKKFDLFPRLQILSLEFSIALSYCVKKYTFIHLRLPSRTNFNTLRNDKFDTISILNIFPSVTFKSK